MEDVDLNQLIDEIKILFSNNITEKNAVITTTLLPVIHLYKAPLLQLFQNIISNALKYSRPNGQVCIHIDAQQIGSSWQFAVSDNGIGISPVYFDKIFVIFQRLHNKDQYSGTGIGLAICKKIIDKMGGQIWVESVEGKGSTFYFTMTKLTTTEIS
jgi:light-regulated signal transduction histidine kinase (bacteriophytochrome)